MNFLLQHDIDFANDVEKILAMDEVPEEERNALMEGLVNNHLQSVEKINSMIWWTEKKASEIEMIKAKIKQMQSYCKAVENKTDYIKNSIQSYMEAKQYDKLELKEWKISFRKSTQTIIDNLEYLPAKFVKVTVEKSADKNAIKEAIQNGEHVDGAHLEDKRNLSIR
jgi:NCAIR mutase (PurE)-related protein